MSSVALEQSKDLLVKRVTLQTVTGFKSLKSGVPTEMKCANN